MLKKFFKIFAISLALVLFLANTVQAQFVNNIWYKPYGATYIKPSENVDLGSASDRLGDIYAGTLNITGLSISGNLNLNDDDQLQFGDSQDADITYDTTDANANMLKVGLPTGDATNVPVLSVGLSSTIIGADLGIDNGETDPTISIYSADGAKRLALRALNSGAHEVLGTSTGADQLLLTDFNTIYTPQTILSNDNNYFFGVGGGMIVKNATAGIDDMVVMGLRNNQPLVLTTNANASSNFGKGTSADPRLYITSQTAFSSDTSQWVSFYHNGTDAITDVGTGDFVTGANVSVAASSYGFNINANKTGAFQGMQASGSTLALNSGAFGGIVVLRDNSGNSYVTAEGVGTTIEQITQTSGSPTLLSATGSAHTTLDASSETTDILFDLARTVQFSAGALTNQRAVQFNAPIYAFTGASTITNAATIYIDSAPTAGTNATITNSYALWVDSGDAQLDGDVFIGGAGYMNNLYFAKGSQAAGGIGKSTSGTAAAVNIWSDDGDEVFQFTSSAHRANNFDFNIQTNPTVLISADVNPDVSNNHGGYFFHDQTDFVVSTRENVGTGSTPATINNGFLISPSTLTSSGTDNFALRIERTLDDATAAGGSDKFVGISGQFTPTDINGWDELFMLQLEWNALPLFSVDFEGNTFIEGGAQIAGRILPSQGTQVASANNLTLGSDGIQFEITGTTQINCINGIDWENASEITLWFTSTPTVKHNQACTGDNVELLLDGAVDYAPGAGDGITLKLSEIGGNQAWRSVGQHNL